MANGGVRELVLADLSDGAEARRVSLIEGASWAVVEHTSGVDTEVAYGARTHGHKLMAQVAAFAVALGVSASEDGRMQDGAALCAAVEQALQAFFAVRGGEAALLSDLMDCFDAQGVPYTYTAWTSEGDAVLRAVRG